MTTAPPVLVDLEGQVGVITLNRREVQLHFTGAWRTPVCRRSVFGNQIQRAGSCC